MLASRLPDNSIAERRRSPSGWIKQCIQIFLLVLFLQLLTNTIKPITRTRDTFSRNQVNNNRIPKYTSASSNNTLEENVNLFSVAHFDSVGNDLGRIFPPWQPLEGTSWCIFKSKSSSMSSPSGLIYVRVPKAASSTLAGIARRIAVRHGRGPEDSCALFDEHVPDHSVGSQFGHRDKTQSFLLSAVRSPSSRAMSRVFFSPVSQKGIKPTDENIIGQLQNSHRQKGAVSQGQGGFQLAYLSLRTIPPNSAWSAKNRTKVLHPRRVQDLVQGVIEDYDFLVVVERMDESLVAMQLLLGLDAGDILSTASKVGGGFYYVGKTKKCIRLVKSFTSPVVSEYLSSEEWYAQNYGDFLLHAAANRSLDLTIERLGRTRFESALAKFRALKTIEEELCAERAVFPCSAEGIPQPELSKVNCYERDHGCGYPCIDDMLRNLSLAS